MEIYLDRRAVRQIRTAAKEAIADGASETLREDIHEAFADDDVRAVEKLLDGIEMYDYLSSVIDEWSCDDLDELFELLESQFAELGIDLTSEYRGDVDDTEVLEDEDEFPPTPDLDEEEEAL